jgi:hypothetical protein
LIDVNPLGHVAPSGVTEENISSNESLFSIAFLIVASSVLPRFIQVISKAPPFLSLF